MELDEHDSDLVAPEELERSIVALPDVRAARVVAARSGRITEIHLIADGGRTPKQLVRDVQTIAQANFSIDLDHRIVSVVTFSPDHFPSSASVVELASISWTTERSHATCRVRLEGSGESALGESSGAATASGRGRLAAEATVQALLALHGRDPLVDVAEIRSVDIGGHRVSLVLLVLLNGDGTETIVAGSAVARGDEGEAIVGAVLDAYNRRREE